MKYQIFLNQEKDEAGRLVGMMDGYLPGNEMELADAGDLPGFEPPSYEANLEAAEELFRIYNMDHPARYRNRSLSVGDVVVLRVGRPDVAAFACARFGFEPLARFEYEVPTR